MAGRQLRLLLWKDYLIRKRQPITMVGILWAVGVISSICIVRYNIDNQDFPTCQYAARALPSAGLLTFLQSFICNINNECSPMEDFQEIPTYEKSKLTQLKKQLAPLIYNESVIEVAGTIPDALKLVATLADVADEPAFLDFTKNGIYVEDLFRNPKRVSRYLSDNLEISADVASSVMSAQLSLTAMDGVDRCSGESMMKTIKMANPEHLSVFVKGLCSIKKDDLQKVIIHLLFEMDIGKFVTVAGNMYRKVSGDARLARLGDTSSAALRMLSPHSFLPPELNTILYGDEADFSYFPLTMVNKFVNIFQPTFGTTQSFKTFKDMTDSIVLGVKYLSKVLKKEKDTTDTNQISERAHVKRLSSLLNNSMNVAQEISTTDTPLDVFNILTRITNLILQFLPKEQKHDVLFYSTLLSKLIEVAHEMVHINTNIEQLIFDVSSRNPAAVRELLGLPLQVVASGLEGLADPERAQIITSNLANPAQPFCDLQRVSKFFLVSKEEATNLKSHLCANDWKQYVQDMITSFGTYEAKNNINSIASLFVSNTIGSDVSEQLYTIEKDLEIFKNFTQLIANLNDVEKPTLNWSAVFNQEKDAAFLKVVQEKEGLGKLILLTVHGCLAKEVVKQNPLLEFKISPLLKDVTTMVEVINEQLKLASRETADRAKAVYPDLLRVLAMTALDERKTYKALSSPSDEIFCRGAENASFYLNFPLDINRSNFVDVLCNVSMEIENGLNSESLIFKGIAAVKTANHSVLEEINWTKLIKGLKHLYVRLEQDYPYVFQFRSYGMDRQTQHQVDELFRQAKDYWFSLKSLKRMCLLIANAGLRVSDALDHAAFGLAADGWLRAKYYLAVVTGPLDVVNDFIQLLQGISKNEAPQTDVPVKTSAILRTVLLELPQLVVETVNIIVKNDVEVKPIVDILNADPPWPCGPSLTRHLHFTPPSEEVVKSMETLICFNRTFQTEWKPYLDQKNVTLYRTAQWNTTRFAPNVFLKFSSAFDRTIDNLDAIEEIVQNTLNESDNGRLSVVSAWKYTVDTLNTSERDIILRRFFTKVDSVVNAINTSSIPANVTLSSLWLSYGGCCGAEGAGRAAWTNLLKFFSMTAGNVSSDIATYLIEANNENATVLQLLGFTRRTPLHTMYDNIAELVGVLVNSYWDFGFMQQVRRASLTQFWDCEAVVAALAPGPGAALPRAALQPLLCPSLLHWLSLPTGANTLMDVVTKPQYLLFTLHVSEFESVYDKAYIATANLSNTLKEFSQRNKTKIDLSLDTLKTKLERAVDSLISYRINATNPSYIAFNEVMKKQSVSTIYLTRITAIVNKIANLLNTLKIEDVVTNISDDDKKAIENDMNSVKRLFKRRASDVNGIHLDVITDVLWTNRNDYKLTNALEMLCDNIKNNDTSKEILGDNTRIKAIICSKQYKIIYNAVQHVVDDDFDEARNSLLNVVKVLQTDHTDDVNNIFEFVKDHDSVVASMKKSIKYASDLDIPIYLQYLGSNLQHQRVVLAFLAGDDWWRDLRSLYAGERATSFLDSVEKSFDIADDILHNLDQIHLVRLYRDLTANSSRGACAEAGAGAGAGAAEYAPDASGSLSALRRQLCAGPAPLFRELPPLRFASQGYEDSLKLPSTVNYNELNTQMSEAEHKLASVAQGPRSPRRPEWVSGENLARFRSSVLDLLSKRTLTKIGFGVLSNVVDASTLYLNDTYCSMCSEATSWAKQITLQLFKKQDYDGLLCSVRQLPLGDVRLALRDRFHWDMAVGELISTRNYTKYELNKSLNELLEQIKLNLLEDVTADRTALADCLAGDSPRNGFGNATVIIKLLSGVSKLFRSYLPHLRDIAGFTAVPYMVQLQTEIAHNLDVYIPLEQLQRHDVSLTQDLDQIINDTSALPAIKYSTLNINAVKGFPLEDSSFKLNKTLCKLYNCTEIVKVLRSHLNTTLISRMVSQLPDLQKEEFWRFNFISNILEPVEVILEHVGTILRFLSKMDLEGVLEGKLTASIDFVMQILMDDTLHGCVESVHAILEQTAPLLRDTALRGDVSALTDGLRVLAQLKNYVIDQDIHITPSDIFKNPALIELSLKEIGVNNTAFWSVAANLYEGQIRLEPLLSQKSGTYSIKAFACEEASLSQILVPRNLDNVTSAQLYSAVKEQFCDMQDGRAEKIVPVLIENINFTFVLDRVKSFLLTKLYQASGLTAAAGHAAAARAPDAAALLPLARHAAADLAASLAAEPLLQRLKGGSSIGDIISSPELLAAAGNLVCGKPFYSGVSRFYKSIVSSVDLSSKPDERQLQLLPTEFCRSLYTDVVSMDGGKIVWSFVKPLLMGKILYTPPSPAVRVIVEKANSTFAPMAKMFDLVHSFANAFPSIDKMSAHRAGLKALQQLLSADEYRELRVALLGDVSAPHIDVDELLDGIGDSEGLGRLLERGSQLVRCIDLDRFRPAADERRLAEDAARLADLNEFTAGLVFLNMSETQSSLPLNIEYKIRMDIENSPTTKRIKNYLWTPGPEANFLENMRYFRGFIQVQDIVERAIIQLSSPRRKRQTEERDSDWAVYMQQNPYPCYRKDLFQTSLYESQALIVAFFFSFLFIVSSAVRFILVEKETGNTMLMSVMGVELRHHTLSWFLSSLLEMAATMLLVSAALHYGRVLPRTAPSLTFTLLFIFGLSVLSFCYLMGKLFSSASAGAVCAALAFLTTFMPFVLILSLEAVLTSGLKIFVSLSMSSALCYAFLLIARLEAMGAGAGWAQLGAAPGAGDMSIALAAAMMLLDACLYFLIGYIVEYFWGLKKIQSNITHITSTGDKVGVSIINITKVYGRGTKPALAGVSMELRPGQVTTLLGHNGAGKSTLINILTGTLRPSSGRVEVRSGPGVEAAGARVRARVGVCPQRDVLWEQLSAREHVQLYARLSRAPSADVDRILRALSLGAAGAEPAARLSGGTRRRLAVALAFVGRAPLVTLDEPTSGVDPHARREIWSMMMKLRANRTILLTTHHMDEAELLSDQVVILHKGRIHTAGSPLDIKRSLGSGYRLTVHFGPADVTGADSAENAKKVLEVARSVAPNAGLVRAAGGEVELSVPFCDDHGASNDFEALCSSLEQGEAWLGYRSFGVECTTLEQVLFDISHQQERDSPHAVDTSTSKTRSFSTSSMKADSEPLVPAEGPLKGSTFQQFQALLHKRYLHYTRNRWLLFLLLALPSLFVAVAMGFASIRPPADSEVSLRLEPALYAPTTDYLVPYQSESPDDTDSLARRVMDILRDEQRSRNWTSQDSLTCKCVDATQQCEVPAAAAPPDLMLLPDVDTLNDWLVTSQQPYIEKRYGGYTASSAAGGRALVAWFNNKGHHAAPAYLHGLARARLRAARPDAALALHAHPLKISAEQLNRDNVYQHIADAGISALLLLGYSLVSAGASIYLVTERVDQQKRLQLLCGVSPALYWATALLCDMTIIIMNLAVTVVILKIFNFPVFVARNNLYAICILILLYGFGCAGAVHVLEKAFAEPSLASTLLFCGNAFVALAGLAALLVLDIISDSDATDHARWVLHKVLLLSPQFVLGDGLLEIAKNTIQAQVLGGFGLDTYREPLGSTLLILHFAALLTVGTALHLLNLAIEYHCFDGLLARWSLRSARSGGAGPGAAAAVRGADAEREERRVSAAVAPLRLRTIGNINAGFVYSKEDLKSSPLPGESTRSASDVISCVHVGRRFPAAGGFRRAVDDLTLGIPPAQCTALLGQNGAGKSSTFKMLTAELRPTEGRLYIRDRPATQRDLCQGLISYCPQRDALDSLLTVRETLQFFCKLRGLTHHDEVIKRTVEQFELCKYLETRSGALSGGNKRKLSAAVAFMGRNPLVLLDEPTSGMDPGSRLAVAGGWARACGTGRAVLVSTHALHDARRAHRVALLRAGRLRALAPLADSLARFGGGYAVCARVCGAGADVGAEANAAASARAVWARVASRVPHATLTVAHATAIHFIVPTLATVGEKEVVTRVSDVFRLMGALQREGLVDDFTLNQTSLEQMFLNCSDESGPFTLESDLEQPSPSPNRSASSSLAGNTYRRASDDLSIVTAL